MYGYMRSTLSSETPNQNRETLSQKSTTKQSITQRRNQPVFKSRRHKKPGFFQRLRRSKALVDNKNDEKTIDHIFDSNQITDLNTSRNSYLSTDPVDDYVDEICGSSSNSVESNEEDDKVPDQLIKPSSINSSFQSFFSPSYCNYSLSTGKSFESLNTSTANGSTWTVNIVNELPRTTLKDVLKDVSLEKRRRLTITLDGTQGSLVGTHNNIYGTQGGLAGTHSNIYGTQGSLISTNIYSTQKADTVHNNLNDVSNDQNVKTYDSTEQNELHYDVTLDITHDYSSSDETFNNETIPSPIPSEYNKDFEANITKEDVTLSNNTDSTVPEEIYKPHIVLRPKKVKDQLIQQINNIYQRYSMKRKESMVDFEDTIRHSLYDIQYTSINADFCRTVEEKESSDIVVGGVAKERVGLVADVTLDLSNLENNEVVHAVITDQVKDRLEYNETAMCHNYDKAAHSPIGETRKCACACFKTTVTQSTAYSETCCCVDMRHEDDVKVVDNSDDETWSCKINEKIQKSCMASPAGAPVLCGTKDSVQDKGLANDRAQKELSVDIQDTSFCHDTPSVDTFLHSNAPKKLAQFSPLIIETSTKVTKPSLDKESAVPLLRSPIIPSLSLPTPTQQFSPAFERPHQEVEATFIAQESHKALDALTVSNVEQEFSCNVTQQEQLLIKEEEDGFASLNLSDQNKEKDVFTVTAIAVDLASDDRVENCNATLKITAEEQEEYSEIVCQHLGLVNKEQNKEELVEATVHTTEFDEVKLAISWIDCVFAQSYANYNAQHLVSQVAQQTEEFAVTSAYFSFDKNGSNSSIGHIYDGITKNGEVLSIKCDSNENKDLVENYIHVNTCENEHHFTTLHKALTVPSISPSTNSTSNTISEVPDDPTIEFNDDALLKYGEMIMLPSDHNKVTAGFELGGNAGSEGTSRAKQDNIDDRDVIIQKLLKDIVDKVVQTHLEQFEKRFGYQNKSSPAKLNLMGWFDNSDLVQEQIAEVEFQHTIKFGNKLAMLSDDNEIPISDDEYENPSMDDSTATITSNASKLVLNSTAEEKNGTEPAEINGKENNGTSSNGVNGLSEPLGLGGSNTSTPIEHAPSNGGRPDESDEQAVDEEAAVFKDANITVSIRAYEKRSEGFNAYIVYKIETKVNGIPNYTKSMNEVWRRFSDFLGLRDKLAEKYQHKGVAIPLAPEKSIAALTKTKLNTTNDEGYTTDVAEKRARLLERFLRRLVRSPRLVVDCDLVDFLSLDANLPKASFTAALSTKSMQKIFKSVGDALNKIAYPMDENDRWFEQMHGNVEELDDMLVRLYSIVDQLGSYRKELSQSSDSLSKSLSMIASCEENTALARTLSKLAETKENLSVVQRHEADTDSQILAESIQEHLHMTQVLKELFFERVKAWQNWQTLRQNLAKKRELKARFDLAGRPDRANVAKAEVEDCEQKVDKMEQEFQEMSKTIRREYIRLCKERRTDLKTAFVSYLEALIESEQHTLEHWQKFAPEVQSII
ncbi:unnamed protein product [Bursaphelenchus okinawaensis]|uniref:PX domain-containing protein n=1 Tax=Bursaphelenchus okinawaensis TaxID=465554 RepID=A0A811JUS1_9BILA|nr:unnamed protein product [Bursaphelenchus okinawaensis]CAG9084039.1 unnamed protein product [Bursaphelenchus okinawaensis]